jgi:hypothetical protein
MERSDAAALNTVILRDSGSTEERIRKGKVAIAYNAILERTVLYEAIKASTYRFLENKVMEERIAKILIPPTIQKKAVFP